LVVSVCVVVASAAAAGPAPIVPTVTSETIKMKSLAATVALARAVDWSQMLLAKNADFDASPRTGEWSFATAEWEKEQGYKAFVHVCEAEERAAAWQQLHANAEVKAVLAKVAELEKNRSRQMRTIPVSEELKDGDAFFVHNKDIKPSEEMIAHDKATDKRVRTQHTSIQHCADGWFSCKWMVLTIPSLLLYSAV
jgi:hypothetical protein